MIRLLLCALTLAVYDARDGRPLPGGERLPAGEVEIDRAGPLSDRFRPTGRRLSGEDLDLYWPGPDEVAARPGRPLDLDLLWRASRRPAQD